MRQAQSETGLRVAHVQRLLHCCKVDLRGRQRGRHLKAQRGHCALRVRAEAEFAEPAEHFGWCLRHSKRMVVDATKRDMLAAQASERRTYAGAVAGVSMLLTCACCSPGLSVRCLATP